MSSRNNTRLVNLRGKENNLAFPLLNWGTIGHFLTPIWREGGVPENHQTHRRSIILNLSFPRPSAGLADSPPDPPPPGTALPLLRFSRIWRDSITQKKGALPQSLCGYCPRRALPYSSASLGVRVSTRSVRLAADSPRDQDTSTA